MTAPTTMSAKLFSSCILAMFLCGCSDMHRGPADNATSGPAAKARSVDRAESVELGGAERTYWLHLPASYDSTRPAPLVLVLHGEGSGGRQMAQWTDFSALADEEGFIVAYPEGIDRHWSDPATIATSPQADDVRFLTKLIDQLSILLAINPKRVYAAGFSSGGLVVQRLGCRLSGKLAGIACVAAPLPADMADKCTPTLPVSVLMIHGTADAAVPYEGGRMRGYVDGKVLSVGQTIDRWLTADGCTDPSPNVTTQPAAGDKLPVRCQSYSACGRGTAVVLYTIDGGGHTWPGGRHYGPIGRRQAGPVSNDLDATRTIWEFFKMHPKL